MKFSTLDRFTLACAYLLSNLEARKICKLRTRKRALKSAYYLNQLPNWISILLTLLMTILAVSLSTVMNDFT